MYALAAAAAGLALALAWRLVVYPVFVYPVFVSPLARVPAAHPLAHLTALWIQWCRWRGTDFECIAAAFAAKGPYVRLGPRELGVNAVEAVRSVYGVGASSFDRHPSYEFFMTHGIRNTFTLLGIEHRWRRRRISAVYSRASVSQAPQMRANFVAVVAGRLRPLLAASASAATPVNAMPLSQCLMLDFISAFAYGLPRGFCFFDDAARRRWLALFNLAYPSKSAFWLKEHPRLARLLCALGLPLLPAGRNAAKRELEHWALDKADACEAALRASRAGADLPPGDLPVLYGAVRTGMAAAAAVSVEDFVPSPAERLELASECLDHISATSETFGTTFTYLLFEVSRHPDVQERLRSELLSINDNPFRVAAAASPDALPAPDALERLPFLDAVIKESLRLRNTTPNFDPRLSPADRPARVSRIADIPPGTRIGAYGWWLNRNPDVYPDPDTWNPARWLAGGPKDAADRSQWLFAFGAGSRGCVGQSIAMEMMRQAIAAIYTTYTSSIVDQCDYPGANRFISITCDEKLLLRFDKLTA